MAEPFRTRVTVRGYELDTQGHLNQSVYLQYAEHARWECLRAAGITQDRLLASKVGPVALETTIRYLRELRGGDEVDVSCDFEWPDGKVFRIVQHIVKTDGTVAAEINAVAGLLDLRERRLLDEPRTHLLGLATHPDLVG